MILLFTYFLSTCFWDNQRLILIQNAKDNNKDIDVSSFEYLWGESYNTYSKDKNAVYRWDKYFSKVTWVNPITFQYLWWEYGKDDVNAFYRGVVIEWADINSFKYAWDFYLTEASQNSPTRFAYDKNNFYYSGKIIWKTSRFWMVLSTRCVVKSNILVICYDNLNQDIIKSFKLQWEIKKLIKWYYTDWEKIYHGWWEVGFKEVSEDVENFELVWNYHAKDKTSIFLHGNKIEWIDVGSFQELNVYYVRDKDTIFHEGLILSWADIDSFMVYSDLYQGEYVLYAKDKNNVYHYWEIIKNVNPQTFDPTTYSRDLEEENKKEAKKQAEVITKELTDYINNNQKEEKNPRVIIIWGILFFIVIITYILIHKRKKQTS